MVYIFPGMKSDMKMIGKILYGWTQEQLASRGIGFRMQQINVGTRKRLVTISTFRYICSVINQITMQLDRRHLLADIVGPGLEAHAAACEV